MSPHAEEASHLFFGEANRGLGWLGGWFATHPPLQERIRRLGGVPLTPMPGLQTMAQPQATPSQSSPGAAAFMSSLGSTHAQDLLLGRSHLDSLHPDLKAAVPDPLAATALVFALLVRTKPPIQAQQLKILVSTYGPDCKQRVGHYYPYLSTLDQGDDWLLIDAVVPALKSLDPEARQQLCQTTQALSQPQGRLMLKSFTLHLVLRKRLCPESVVPGNAPITTLDPLWPDTLAILGLLARVGHSSPGDALYAFKLGLSHLPGAKKRSSPNQLPKLNTAELHRNLEHLEQAESKLKQAIVDACAHVVLADNEVTPGELNLLRAVASTLDCPTPPFLR